MAWVLLFSSPLVLSAVPQWATTTREAHQRCACGRYCIADLDSEGQRQIVAYGGEGGSAVTNDHYNGLKGDSRRLVLELKSIADIGQFKQSIRVGGEGEGGRAGARESGRDCSDSRQVGIVRMFCAQG